MKFTLGFKNGNFEKTFSRFRDIGILLGHGTMFSYEYKRHYRVKNEANVKGNWRKTTRIKFFYADCHRNSEKVGKITSYKHFHIFWPFINPLVPNDFSIIFSKNIKTSNGHKSVNFDHVKSNLILRRCEIYSSFQKWQFRNKNFQPFSRYRHFTRTR